MATETLNAAVFPSFFRIILLIKLAARVSHLPILSFVNPIFHKAYSVKMLNMQYRILW